eukprot:CAMPEP_0181095424 /NCGR_PEP_ID=MMETSP1071-20121207/10509_1 /TAXON_ID=35127 /ORGANISM="Thalassiosira sp., Strain NH16" /LENGTH=904 /DNA_ID=CAMNT_0023177799 /DNA_START=157 /DNA_END=2871 /DNA_ORIENTATION=-
MKRSCRNAALLAFAAHVLDVDVSSASSFSSAAPARSSSRSSLLRRSSLSRRSPLCGFVHQETAAVVSGRSEALGGGRPSKRSRTVATPAPSRIWRQHRNVGSARPTQRAGPSSAVAPRFYVESSSSEPSSGVGSSSEEVLVYRDPNLDGEFSLLRPHLEFNELDLQELFSQDGRAGSTGRGESSATASSSSSSQLYEEFEEVEIGHFQPANRVNEGEADSRSSSSPFFFASPQKTGLMSSALSSQTEELDLIPLTLPPWLSLNQGRFAPMKLRKLQRDLGPHLSSKEIEQVVSAIHLASGDNSKIAGAADFCSILVNSLEMTDVPTLCAAAFHYSSLVSVRERELNKYDESCFVEESQCLQTAGSDAKYLCALAGSGVENFGTHAVKIALDAARLKSMETLAATVVRKNGKLGQLRSADARNLRSLLLTVNEEGDWRALAIRSAACLYRLEGLEAHRTMMSTAGGPKRTRSATPQESRASQEALHIYAPLAARLGMFRLKTELEDAAFRTMYPRSHAKVSALCGGENTNSVGEGMKSVLTDISNQMKRLVQEDCTFMNHIENVSVTARVKEPYSVWRKMLKISKASAVCNARDLSVLDIPDAVATRVVFSARKLTPDESDATTQRREKEMCYYLYDVCTRNWPKTCDSRFKDYVKNPKDNGYQSLHYSSRKRWRGTEWPFEVQIRSRDMHRIAEYGVAAHWSYKRNDIDDNGDNHTADTGRNHRLDRTSEAYLKSVQEWRAQQASRSYVDTPSAKLEEPASHLGEEIRRQRKRERDETLAPYLEALSGAQTDMTRENVFVFVSVQPPREDSYEESSTPLPQSEGTVMSLPRGSRVLDAIRLTEKWSSTLESSGHLYDGRSSFTALRNGLRTSSMGTELLVSGDFVSILPSDELVPSPTGGPFFK